ncbi:MAG: M24 family metallopeptidase, partial [candidate division Zixibacteria bacterium]|nr:M24 family metallopeptidase [candidate division Zixibacteria bacterium]
MNLQAIQQALREQKVDGWLFYDFRNRDPIAYRILDLEFGKLTSRRWYYFIPAEGEPVKLVHGVEKTKLDKLPGKRIVYSPWKQMHRELENILGNHARIVMNYSPLNNIPYVSIVDGGTVELIKSMGYEVVTSADLVQQFEAVIDEDGYQSHVAAGEKVQRIKDEAFAEIGKAINEDRDVTEYDIQQFIVRRFEEEGLTNDGEHPIVGVNEHPADPHFEVTPENTYVIRKGDTVLIDLWARVNRPGTIYFDITWSGYVGENPPAKYVEIFTVVCNARDAAKRFVEDKFRRGETCYGWEVDDACRNVVKAAGYGDYFVHRTGHSIGTEVHGNGVNMDNLETKDERKLVPGICFSIEPGIYFEDEMAARSEIDVYITLEGKVVVSGREQQELVLV